MRTTEEIKDKAYRTSAVSIRRRMQQEAERERIAHGEPKRGRGRPKKVVTE